MGHERGQVSDSYGLTTLDALSGGDTDEDGHGPIPNAGAMSQGIGHVRITEDLVLQSDVAAAVAAPLLIHADLLVFLAEVVHHHDLLEVGGFLDFLLGHALSVERGPVDSLSLPPGDSVPG